MRSPTDAEMEVMIRSSMDELLQASGGDFDKYAVAFFRAGFRCGVSSLLLREVLDVAYRNQ